MEEEQQYMLTTIDNPFNPFIQFDEWNAFDISMDYHTCAYLARVAKTSDELSEIDEALAIDLAMDEIVSFNLNGKYIKVNKEQITERLKLSQNKAV